jgi:hypothetical protein
MTEDKLERMRVYAAGRSAFYGDVVRCPYSGWRAGTWAKGFESAKQAYADDVAAELAPGTDELDIRIGQALTERLQELCPDAMDWFDSRNVEPLVEAVLAAIEERS